MKMPLYSTGPEQQRKLSSRFVLLSAAVAITYVAAAEVGFRAAFVAEQVTTVWAPTGIAIASLLIWGPRLWLAIWLGAFAVNAATNAPLWTAFVVATGNTLEAVLATQALRRVPQFDFSFRRVTDVLTFISLAVVAAPAVSATVGTATLCAAGVQSWQRFAPLWFDWWLGDALGALVVAPAILTIAAGPRLQRQDSLRLTVFVTGSVVITHLAFSRLLGLGAHPLEYVVFPLVIAAALIGGPPVSAMVVLASAMVTIWNTVSGAGPFAQFEVHRNLILLQTFTGVLASTAMLLSAAIAERKASELRETESAGTLRHREEMLRLAQRAGGVATFEWDFQNQLANCSAEFFEMFGLLSRDGQMQGAEWAQFVHPDDRERMAAHLGRALQGTEPAATDYRIIRADGVERWLTYAGQIRATPSGARMLGTVVDITDRKRMESDLRHHVAEVERILGSIGEGFVAMDHGFRYVYVNPPAEQMLGRSRAELIGRTPWEVFPEEIVRESRQRLHEIQESGQSGQYEIHIPTWNRWFENRVYPAADGLTIFFADITARIKADEALRESRDVLSLAMRGGAMGAWSRNLTTNDVWWSRELEEIFGIEPGAFNRTEAGFFDLIDPDHRIAVRHAVDTAVETRSDYVVEFRFRHANGEWRWMEGRGRAVYADDGTALSLYGIGIDVTARKRAETVLQEAKDAAESANQVKDQFLATLSHELRTPLNAILGYARMLQTNAIAPQKRQRAIDIIERNAAAQNQLIEDLLDISRITRGQVRLELASTPIGAVLQEAIEGVRPAAEAKRLALDIDIDPNAGMVTADAARLQQVFWNLLTNAVKFTSEGGLVSASIRRGDDDKVEVVVSDTGEGIAAEFLPFLFEPFRQADAKLVRGHGGLGLGLAISRHLVELHGGTVRAESAGVGRGATFVVRLPRQRDSDVNAPTRGARVRNQAMRPIAGGLVLDGVDILLVDDDEDTLTLFRDSLEAAGARVRAVMTSADALREYGDRPPDLLVTDLGLPEMDGLELLDTIRTKSPNIPAVAVTGYARLGDRARALGAGFQAHVSKPIDPASFVQALAAAISQVE
jgi:PAS domain S-box-containing protein